MVDFVKIRLVTKKSETSKLLADAASWFAEQLLNPFQIEILRDINIYLCSLGEDWGRCRALQPGTERARDFEILIAPTLDDYWKVRTLAHEFVHVKQRVNQELTYSAGGRRFWKGKDVTDLPYLEQPHEKEALALEQSLAEEFLVKFKGWRLKKDAA